jgi:hypothetical protein
MMRIFRRKKEIGDRVRIKWIPDKVYKIIGISKNRYKVRELSKEGTIWYGLRLEDI